MEARGTPSPKALGNKASVLEMFEVEVVSATAVVPLSEISVGESSGWRELTPERVEELKEIFMRGEYDKNVLKKPSLRHVGYLPKTDAQGMKLVFDGKHTTAALKEL